jgi:hypothetical protein
LAFTRVFRDHVDTGDHVPFSVEWLGLGVEYSSCKYSFVETERDFHDFVTDFGWKVSKISIIVLFGENGNEYWGFEKNMK